ncbi:antitermination regulator [Mycolicibacterium sphagni]|nr:antitermination regulator [Mycolicibacterium sphagni]
MQQHSNDETRMRQCAEGVLVALKRCTMNAASGEIAQASQRHQLNSWRVSQALVRLAQEVDPEADSNATAVARFEWGALLARRARP